MTAGAIRRMLGARRYGLAAGPKQSGPRETSQKEPHDDQILTDHRQSGSELTHPVWLTRREQGVRALLFLRRTNVEMAQPLSVSIRTIETHIARILQKLAVSNRRDTATVVRNPYFFDVRGDGSLGHPAP